MRWKSVLIRRVAVTAVRIVYITGRHISRYKKRNQGYLYYLDYDKSDVVFLGNFSSESCNLFNDSFLDYLG